MGLGSASVRSVGQFLKARAGQPPYRSNCPGVSYTQPGSPGSEIAAAMAFTSAAMPSIFRLDFSLSSLMLPAASFRDRIARMPAQDRIPGVANLAGHDQLMEVLVGSERDK